MVKGKYPASSKATGNVSPSRLAASLAFDGGVEQVKGVSGERCLALGRMGIHSVRDLATHFPRRYVDMSAVETIAAASIGESCTISAQVYETKLKKPKPRLSLVEITLVDGTGTMIVTCFRQPWLAEKLQLGMNVAVSGKVEFGYGFKRMTNPFLEQTDSASTSGVVIPVHPACEKVPSAWMRRLVGNALDLVSGIDDPLPLYLRERYRLASRQSALRAIHFPMNMDEVAQARRRLTYEELLLLELHLMRRSREASANSGFRQHVIEGSATKALQSAVPFTLTEEQEQARLQILGAMAAPRRANHMLLGDVGTGKTIVAAFALTAAADTGSQALMMAPTEVLASQYAKKLGPLLDEAGVSWGLLTGSTDAVDKEILIGCLSEGSLQVLFGTHALLEPEVNPKDCSVVVIDEQQRFGVAQREALAEKGGGYADVISLTATPIPRSLALALYGDMTLSYIRNRPLNRAVTQTKVFSRTMRGEAYDIALSQLQAGHQVYVVCPLVGEAKPEPAKKKSREDADLDEYAYSSIAIESEGDFEGADTRAALQQAEFLSSKVFPGYAVDVLHGKMRGDQKQEIMDRFRSGDIQVLVSTTVIEVGVDVPNATVMIVEEADRFGLAQLHQLRGRVGRGVDQGYMCLISGSKAPTAIERLSAMERTDDGFELAEYDLSLRREGDILGNRQHGASVLKLVNVVRDAVIIEAAHADATEILDADPDLNEPLHQGLRYELARVFPDVPEGRSA